MIIYEKEAELRKVLFYLNEKGYKSYSEEPVCEYTNKKYGSYKYIEINRVINTYELRILIPIEYVEMTSNYHCILQLFDIFNGRLIYSKYLDNPFYDTFSDFKTKLTYLENKASKYGLIIKYTNQQTRFSMGKLKNE